MKTLFLFVISCVTCLAVLAQASTVTINVRGNNTQQVVVDGRAYTVTGTTNNTNTNNNNSNDPISITDLQTGQHTLQVISVDPNDQANTTTFNLRSGYDMQITVTANGSVQIRETKWRADNNNSSQYRTPMSDANFNALYRQVNNQWRSASRVTLVNNAFANTSNYFTSAQVRQLLQLINSQSSRLTLAKASYKTITDPANFYVLNDLFTTEAYRNDLAAYVSTYNNSNSSTAAMSNANYNTIYRAAQRQSTTNAKVNYIAAAFTNTNNYFTVAQASQLIQLASGESNRLYLAKASYRSIVDRANFSRIHSLLNSTAGRNELTVFVNSYDGGTDNPVYTNNTAMSSTDFTALYNRVKNTWGIGAKMSSLTDIFNNESYYFTVAQAKPLIELVSSESNRLELAKSSYNNIVDPSNFSQLYSVLSSQSSRTELEKYVSTNTTATNPNYPARSPLSDASFNTLYNDIQNRWGLGAKMSALTDIFENENNYFTVSQTRKLILLVSDESNRLQLAKSAYGNITDQQNFYTIYDVLASQTSRNELAAYVNSYSSNR
jgi:hypothetical protein